MEISTLIKTGVTGVVVLVVGTVAGFKFFEKVDNGNVGIEYSMNGGVKKEALGQGVHFVGLDHVTAYPIKTQTISQTIPLATRDGKKTDVKVSLSYHIDATKATSVYQKFGNVEVESIEKGWLNQQLTAAGRNALSKFTLLDVVGEDSTKAQAEMLKEVQDRTVSQGFVIEDLSMGTPSLDPQTQQSIDNIIKANQDQKRIALEAKSQQTKAEGDAKAKTIAAEADAKATIAKADATAKANEKINNSITDKTIQYMTAQARQSHGWVEVQGAGSTIVDK